MYQNIKVDIIYFKTPTDFEMEFNLSGCCRMRLLTDKAPDRKTLVNQLVRAVSRSRIIMIAGALFGDDGIITTCSKAIGKPLAEINNSQYGISSEESIEIIKDSIPLVNSNGIFGGCIIEQGPQTLILLSENKDVRKNIMQNLIHSYIKEVGIDELSEKSNTAVVTPLEEALPEDDDIEEIPAVDTTDSEEAAVSEDEPYETESAPENPESENILPDETVIFNVAGEESDNLVEFPENKTTGEDEQNKGDFSREYYKDILISQKPSVENSNLISEDELIFKGTDANDDTVINNFDRHFFGSDLNDENEEGSPTKKKFNLNIPIIIILIVLLLVAAVICYCIFFSSDVDGKNIGGYLKETFDTLFG